MGIVSVGVVGAGQMGAGIAEVVARSGVDVVVREITDELVAAGRDRITASFDRARSKGKLDGVELGEIRYTTDLADMADCGLVVEAIVENPDAKAEVFGALDKACDADTILATNTSSIPIIDVAMTTGRPDRVIGLHFFNPAPVMALVEVIPSLVTDRSVVDQVRSFAADVLGKSPIEAPDQAGFVVNALLVPYLLSAIRMYGDGHATAEDIDTGMKLGCGHPMGPLALSDMIGLDTILSIAETLHAEYHRADCAAPPVLARLVAAGHTGRKSGQGFFSY